ncbi:hypothetical protein L1887_56617 [Cichorium endivia]|nr:hypothetical protein L1887_56617 [Cichorium endivia]
MRLRRKSLQPKSAEEPSDVPALLIECQHVAVLSVRRERLGIQASRPVVWYVVGLVRPAKTAPKQTKRCVPHSRRTASDILEEGGDDVKSAWPLWAGPHTCYNGNYNGKQGCKAERIRKDCLSSDCSLQLGNMKLESLVIADQHAAVNMYPGPVHTARHTLGIGFARSIGPMITHDFCVAVGEPVAGLNPSRWKFPSRCLLPLVAGGRRVQRTRSRGRVIKSKNSIFLLVHQSEIKTNRALR